MKFYIKKHKLNKNKAILIKFNLFLSNLILILFKKQIFFV